MGHHDKESSDVLRQMKGYKPNAHYVVVSGDVQIVNGEVPTETAALEAGADIFFSKPITDTIGFLGYLLHVYELAHDKKHDL